MDLHQYLEETVKMAILLRIPELLKPPAMKPMVFPQNWPTPNAMDAEKGVKRSRPNHQDGITAAVFSQSQDQESNNSHMKSHELNPRWVEQLMGLSTGWTHCGCLEMALSPIPQRKHSEPLEKD